MDAIKQFVSFGDEPFYRTSNAPEFIQEMDIKDVLETPMALAMGHFTGLKFMKYMLMI